jgi:hypothetical protein
MSDEPDMVFNNLLCAGLDMTYVNNAQWCVDDPEDEDDGPCNKMLLDPDTLIRETPEDYEYSYANS